MLIISGENENETAYTYLNDPDNMKFPDDSIDVTSDVKDMPKIMAESGHSHPNQVIHYRSLLDNASIYRTCVHYPKENTYIFFTNFEFFYHMNF